MRNRMRFILSLCTGICTLVLAAAAADDTRPEEKNLVPNGSFERHEKRDKKQPAAWQTLDGLSSFWVNDPLRKGRCMRFDTDIYKEEYLARRKQLKLDPVPPATPKTETKGNKYNTIAAVDGVPFYSEWIDVKPGRYYRLEVESKTEKGRKTPKVFIKGYFADPGRPKKYRRRVLYKKYLNCPSREKRWSRHSTVFCPTIRSGRVKWIRIMLFSYWPPGVYYFDNVKMVPVPPPEKKKKRGN